MLPKTSAYVKNYDGLTKCMYFLIKGDDLLKKYNIIWDRVNADVNKEFYDKLVNNKKVLKTKITSHGDEVTSFYSKKIPKKDSNHTCFTEFCSQEGSELLSESVFKRLQIH